jgi:ATP-dependent RNA helicase DDX24/MAK5
MHYSSKNMSYSNTYSHYLLYYLTLLPADDISALPIEYSFLPALKERVTLARELDKFTHTEKKSAHDDAWIRKLAKEADMDVSDEELDVDAPRNQTASKKMQVLKMKLDQTIRQPLTARGVSFKYITSGSRDFVTNLLNDDRESRSETNEKTNAMCLASVYFSAQNTAR